jgi:type II secretion system protein N
MGRRILHTLEQQTNLTTSPSDLHKRFLGIRWARVEVLYPGQEAFPPVEIQDWVFQLRVSSLLVGRLSARSHGTVLGGAFYSKVRVGRKGHQGLAEWEGIQIDRFPIPSIEEASFGGSVFGKILWEKVDQRIDGEALFEIRDGKIKNVQLSGLKLPLLDLGQISGQMNWTGGRIALKEVSIGGGDLRGRLTGNVDIQNPFQRSRVVCRLEIEATERLLKRYPAIKAFYSRREGQPRPFVVSIRGTVEDPRFSLAK